MTTRWLFGDQLGPHFLDDTDDPVLLVESRAVFHRRRYHRAKAHLVLSAIRHRAAELGERARLEQTTTYAEALDRVKGPFEVCHPTSRAALNLVDGRDDVTILPPRGFATDPEDFTAWAAGRRQLLLESFYRDARRRLDVLMADGEPAGGQWNYDHDNREPPPRGERTLGLGAAWSPTEDDIDEQVRRDLDRWERAGDVSFVGADGPRAFPVTRAEALHALRHFVRHRLADFGRYEDAMLADDPVMAHSRLSVPLNLGLLDPMECVRAAEAAYRDGTAPLAAVEGFCRQLVGWRDYVWHVYWYAGADYRSRNALRAHADVPDWLWDLDPRDVQARCLATVLAQVRDTGWTHHIPRLEVLGNWALQRGVAPDELTEWFRVSFVDGFDWVMAPNVVGMSQHADNGLMATKPYAAGGAYLHRMSDYCGDCRYDPKVRLGDDACPFTAGYWSFVGRHRERLAANPRTNRQVGGFDRLGDGAAVIRQEKARGTDPP